MKTCCEMETPSEPPSTCPGHVPGRLRPRCRPDGPSRWGQTRHSTSRGSRMTTVSPGGGTKVELQVTLTSHYLTLTSHYLTLPHRTHRWPRGRVWLPGARWSITGLSGTCSLVWYWLVRVFKFNLRRMCYYCEGRREYIGTTAFHI